jgi:hypothetical protein
VVGQNHVRAVGDEKISVNVHPSVTQPAYFFEKRKRIENNAISNHAGAARAQDAAGHKLQDEFLAVDDDRVPGIVASRIAGHHGEALREHIDNLPFAFVAPLGANDYRSLASVQIATPSGNFAERTSAPHRVRTLLTREYCIQENSGIKAEKMCTDYLNVFK